METDDTLIRQAMNGDQAAWNGLVHRYRRLVYSVPCSIGLPPEGCDDVFQAVYLALVRNLTTIRECKSLPKWLITTANRESWRWLRRNGTPTPVHTDSQRQSESPADMAERLELQHRVHQALEELGGRCEKLLRMLFVDHPSPPYAAISQVLGIPIGSIGPTRNRCLEKLLHLVDKDDP